jgi:hypothetical protein
MITISPIHVGNIPGSNQVQSSRKNESFRVGLIIFMMVVPAYNRAQAENFEAGKSAQKLFSTNCSKCHSNPRTLSRRMSNWALTEFLREHYTASQTAAYELAAYLSALGKPSPREKQHPSSSRDEPQQSWANQLSAPVERPPESIPTR